MICWGRNQKGEICYISWLFYIWTKSKEKYFFLNVEWCLEILNIVFFWWCQGGERYDIFWMYWWIIIYCNKMRIYVDLLIILKWQIDLCIKIGGDLKISNIKICIILEGAFQEKLQNHKSYKNIISYVSSSKRGKLLALRFQYLLIG